MKKSLARLSFSEINKMINVSKGVSFYTPTMGVEPNNWSTKCTFIEDLRPDDTVLVEIVFLVHEAQYMLKAGNKFKLFGAKQFKCECEILKEIS